MLVQPIHYRTHASATSHTLLRLCSVAVLCRNALLLELLPAEHRLLEVKDEIYRKSLRPCVVDCADLGWGYTQEDK